VGPGRGSSTSRTAAVLVFLAGVKPQRIVLTEGNTCL
jgi:hypothetical protein